MGQEFLDYAGIEHLNPAGVWGRPSRATPEAGRDALEETVRAQVAYVRWVFERLDRGG